MARKSANLAATGAEDGSVKIWDLRNLQTPAAVLNEHTDSVLSIAWSPTDEDMLVTSSADTNVLVPF